MNYILTKELFFESRKISRAPEESENFSGWDESDIFSYNLTGSVKIPFWDKEMGQEIIIRYDISWNNYKDHLFYDRIKRLKYWGESIDNFNKLIRKTFIEFFKKQKYSPDFTKSGIFKYGLLVNGNIYIPISVDYLGKEIRIKTLYEPTPKQLANLENSITDGFGSQIIKLWIGTNLKIKTYTEGYISSWDGFNI